MENLRRERNFRCRHWACLFYEVDAKAHAGMYEIDEINKTALAFFFLLNASLRFSF